MTGESSAANERFQAAQARREQERQHYIDRLSRASSIREYIDIQYSARSAPPQAATNMGYSHMKKHR